MNGGAVASNDTTLMNFSPALQRATVGLVAILLVACGGGSGDEDAGRADAGARDADTLRDAAADRGPSDAGAARDGSSDASNPPDGGAAPWRPRPGTTWYWQLTGPVDRSRDVDVYDIDLFEMTDADVRALKDRGVVLVCYFSAGSYEEWRPDVDDFPSSVLGNPLDGWPGERWLDHRDPAVRAIMSARLDLAVARGCDAVEPDNVDGWANDPGFPLTRDDQLDYLRWLSEQAHARGLSVGLKNTLDLLPEVISRFDWALNEECLQFDECDAYAPALAAGLAVFHVEYHGTLDRICDRVPAGFSSARANLDLDGTRWDVCWGR